MLTLEIAEPKRIPTLHGVGVDVTTPDRDVIAFIQRLQELGQKLWRMLQVGMDDQKLRFAKAPAVNHGSGKTSLIVPDRSLTLDGLRN